MYAEFDLVMPTSLNELTAVVAGKKASEHILLAGGTVTLIDIRSRKEQPGLVVSLDKIAELKGIRPRGRGHQNRRAPLSATSSTHGRSLSWRHH